MMALERNPRPARGNLATAVLIMADRMAEAERYAAILRCSTAPTAAAKAAQMQRCAHRRGRALERLVFALARDGAA